MEELAIHRILSLSGRRHGNGAEVWVLDHPGHPIHKLQNEHPARLAFLDGAPISETKKNDVEPQQAENVDVRFPRGWK